MIRRVIKIDESKCTGCGLCVNACHEGAIGLKNGKKLVKNSKTFVLNKDEEEDSVSILSIYSDKQKDIYNIIPIGKKHDMIVIPQLE